ncbi:MAG: hypothetical protein ACFE9S_15335 [Candidatus Hermodarchaeota archaeon]
MVERAEEIYQALLDAGISENEINEHIIEKESEFQGFMTKPAILYLIAKEYGINVDSTENREILNHITEDIIDYNDFAISISSVVENMRNIVIAGKLETTYRVRDFVKKDGTPGRVGSFKICDNSDCIKVVLWNENVPIMENDLFKKGEIIQIIGGYSKKGRDGVLELHLGRQGKIVLAPDNVSLLEIGDKEVSGDKAVELSNENVEQDTKKNSTYKIQELYEKEGFIRFITGKIKLELFKELTLKNGDKSFLLKLILTDESASIKVNIWGIQAVECLKLISDGINVKLSNVIIKENSYSNEKELNFTKNSKLLII